MRSNDVRQTPELSKRNKRRKACLKVSPDLRRLDTSAVRRVLGIPPSSPIILESFATGVNPFRKTTRLTP